MIIQLPNGRFIECSLEQYLDFDEQDLRDLNGLSGTFTKEYINPFYSPFAEKSTPVVQDEEEYEPDVTEIDSRTKLKDKDFQRDDI